MKKYISALLCAALVAVCSCSKSDPKEEQVASDWDTIVLKWDPTLSIFPEYDGDVEDFGYSKGSYANDFGSVSVETSSFSDYDCAESMATKYYAKFEPAGFTKDADEYSYQKTEGDITYVFTGSYSDGTFSLKFQKIY